DNNAIDYVTNILAGLAHAHDCAVDAPHHTSKGLSEPGNANRGRGASAFKDGGRLVYTLTPMSEGQGSAWGLGEEWRQIIRMDKGKVNLAPSVGTKWFKLVGVPLGNVTELYPEGDNVQTVEPWKPPDMWDSINTATANAILNDIEA